MAQIFVVNGPKLTIHFSPNAGEIDVEKPVSESESDR